MKNDYCVYIHTRPDGSVFYVGKGVPSRPYRRSGRNMTWKAEVEKVGNFIVKIIESGLTEEQAFAKEIELIAEFREIGVNIVNQTKGGDGCKSLVFTDEIKEKLKTARKNQLPPMLGKTTSEKTKQILSEIRIGEKNPMYGKKHTEETKAKFKYRPVAKHWLGKKMTDEARKKMSESHRNKQQLQCPHCQKIGGNAGMKANHFDNCKQLEIA
jgi:hypothetical protein